jgi:hypothetical protein
MDGELIDGDDDDVVQVPRVFVPSSHITPIVRMPSSCYTGGRVTTGCRRVECIVFLRVDRIAFVSDTSLCTTTSAGIKT